VTLSGGADTTVTSGNCYRYRYTISDNVGNQSAPVTSATAKVDTSAPAAPTLTLTESSGLSHVAGSTLYYNAQGTNSGSFTVEATSSDPQSGIAGVDFPTIATLTGGGTDGTDPYSSTYTWDQSTTASGPKTVTVTSGAGDTATATFTVTNDTTAPTGQSIALTGGPYYTATSVPLTLADGSDAGAGLDSTSGVVERDSAALGGGSCGAFSGSWSTVTLSGGADTTVTSGNCYRYRYTISDNVGNTSSPSAPSADAKVDTTAPAVPTVTLSESSPLSHVVGDTLYYNAQGTNSASFTVDASSSDAQSGIAKVTFPSVAGITGGGDDTASPYSAAYTWDQATTAGGAKTVTVTSNAGLTSTATFTLTRDVTAPSGQSVALSGGPWYTALAVPLTLVDGTDAGSGVDASSGAVERDSAPLTGGGCGAFSGSWTTVTLTGGADTTVASGNCYRYRYTISDNVGNTSAPSAATADAKVDTSAPAVPTLTLTESSPLSHVAGSTLYYNAQGANSGSFTVEATSGDAESGIDKVTFPAIATLAGGGDDTTAPYSAGYDWDQNTTASGAKTVTVTNGAGDTATASFTLANDTTAPTGQSIDLTAGPWYTTTSVALALGNGSDSGSGLDTTSALVERDSAPLSGGSCDTFTGTWTTVTLSGGADTTVTSGNCYRYRYTISDNVGNQSAPATSGDAKIDTSAPAAPTLTLTESSPLSHVAGSTLYYNAQGTNSASFTVDATSTDAQSGIAKVTFPTVAGITGGGDDTTSSYTGTYSWDKDTTASGAQTVTVTNAAGDTSTATFTLSNDTTAPSGQSIDLTAGPWYTTTSVPLTIDNGSDTGSGLDTTTALVERDSAPLNGGNCDTFTGNWTTITLTGGADTTVTSGNCYRYRYTITDNVGNQSAPATSGDAKIDTSAPATPTLTLTESSPLSHVAGTTLYYNAQGSNSASFTVDASSTDAQSGIAKVTFPTVAGITGGGDDTTSPYSGTYSWDKDTTASGAHTVTVTNAAGDTSTATFTLSNDTTAPSGQSIDLTAGPWYTTLSVPLTIDNGSDTGSGVDAASGLVERDSAPLNGGNCDAFTGTWTTITLTGGADTAVSSGNCYRYRYTITDNVGNTSTPSTASATAKIDTNGPTAPTLTLTESSPLSHVSGSTLYYNAQGTNTATFSVDATVAAGDSGIDRLTFPTIATLTGGGDDTASPYSSTYTWDQDTTASGAKTVTLTDNAGRTTTATFTLSRDVTAPTGQSVELTAGPWYTTGSVALTIDHGSDAGSGLDTSSALVERDSAPLSGGSCDAFTGSWTTVTLSGGADTSVTSGNCYRYRYTISDNVGNTSAPVTSADAKVDTSAPAAPTLTLTESSPLTHVAGDTLYYNAQGTNSGSFTVEATSSDPQSGIAGVDFPTIATLTGGGTDGTDPYSSTYTWDQSTTASGPKTVTVTNGAGDTATATFTLTNDTTAPTGQSITLAGGPWYSSLAVPLTLGNGSDAGSGINASSGVVERDSAPLSGGSCGAFSGSWSTVTLSGGADTSVTSGSCYRYRYTISDNVGNTSAPSTATADAKVDTSGPTPPTLTLTESSPLSHVAGDTLYYNAQGANSGSFTVDASTSDAQSGIAMVTFPSVAGITGGGDDTTAPYSASYSWDQTTTASGAKTVTVTNAAGDTATATFTLTNDTTAPTGQSIDLTAGPWYTSASVALTLDNGSDAGAGIDASSGVVERDSAPLSGGSCGAFSASWTTVTLTGGADTTVASGNCYRYRYTITDNVGNQSAPATSGIATVDTSAPAAPTLTLTESSPHAYTDGSTLYYSPSAGGSFTVSAAAGDPQSGIASVAFPDVFGSDGGTDAAAPFTHDYSWTGGATADGDTTVTVTSGSGATSTATLSIVRDTTAPSGQSIALGGGPAFTTPSIPLTLGDGTDGQSGVDAASGVVERASAPLLGNGSCDTFGAYAPVTLSGGADTSVVDGACYRYRYTISDNVGNTSAAVTSAVATVDTGAPTVTLTAPGAFVNAADGDPFTLAASAPAADVAQVEFFRCSDASTGCSSGTWLSVGVDTSAPYTASWALGADGSVAVKAVATDRSGNSSSDERQTTVDRTAPAGGSVSTVDGWIGTASVVVSTADGTDAGSGLDLASAKIERDEAPLTGGTCGSFPGSWSVVTSPDTTVHGATCYRYRYSIADHAGNVARYTSADIVKVDLTAPTAPTLTLTESSPFELVTGTTLYYNPSAGNTGSFDVAATTSDAESGIAAVDFPATFGADGSTDSASPYAATYSWTHTATAHGAQTVTATNAAGLTSSATFSVEPDVDAPTGGSISYADGYRTGGSVAVSTVAGADAGAGIPTGGVLLQRASATLANGVCGSYGGFTTIATDPAASYDDTTVAAGSCYVYRLVVTDGVGNQAISTTSSVAKVDSAAPTTALDDPGTAVSGTVTLTSTSADAGGSGLASVAFERSPAGAATWTTIDTDTAAPWSAAFDTTAVADGHYDLRTVATDRAGNVTISTVVAGVGVDNTLPSVSLADPGANVHGTVTLSATVSDTGSGVASTVYQTSPTGQGTWTATPAAWDTTALADGVYDLRVLVTDDAGNQRASTVTGVRVDNIAPVASLDDPGQYVSGTVDLSSSSSDAGSGVDHVTYEYSAAGAGTWTATPAAWSTTALVDGSYDLRVSVSDLAGNVTTSATRTVTVDNTAPTAVMTDPGSPLAGTVALGSTTADGGSGVAAVVYEHSPAGDGHWTPTPAAWNTTLVADGSYDLRVRVTDRAGNSTTSAVVTARVVDNSSPAVSILWPGVGAFVNATTPDPATVSATASDGGSGVASVELSECSDDSVDCATGVWQSLGTDATAPYTASWPLPGDGNRALRAVATDAAGGTQVAVRNVTVDRTAPAATPDDPGAYLRGTVTLTAGATDAGSGVNSVSFQRSPAGANVWTTVGTDTTAPFTASADTTAVADGLYDFRVFVTDVAGNTGTAVLSGRRVDNTAPTVTVTDPGADLRGTVALLSTANDGGSGVASVTYEYAQDGDSHWTTTSALWNTAPLTDGLYQLRAVAVDNAGNQATSASITGIRVDNTVPTATMGDPGPAVRGNVTLSSTSADGGSGVAGVVYQVSPAGQSQWTTTPATWDTTALVDGLYDLHVVVTDNAGNSVVSAPVTDVRVDNTAPAVTMTDPGRNVRGTVALGSTAADAGSGVDQVTYEYSPTGASDWHALAGSGWNTVQVADGVYDVRASVTDVAGNHGTSAPVGNVRVDNTAPTTTANPPAGPQSADVTVTLTGSDAGSGVAQTEYKIDGGSSIQTGTQVLVPAPADHSNDGVHTIQFRSTDAAGNVEAWRSATVAIDTTPPGGNQVDPGSTLRGTVVLATDSTDADISSIAFQYRPTGGSTWTTIGTDVAAPWSVDWDTTTVPDGAYDLRATVSDQAGNQHDSDLPSKVVDNTAPTASITAPAANATISASVTVSASATDATSGVASVQFLVRPFGSATFVTFGSDSTSPYASTLNTTGLPDGAAELQVVVTDVAGNQTTTPSRPVTIDNSASRITLADPGAYAAGDVSLSATAGAGATQVVFQRSPAGAGTWTTFDTDTAAPFTATLSTTGLSDGDYDLRAVSTDGAGHTAASQTRTVRVDNTAPTGSLTAPAAGATVGTSATAVTATADDTGSGVASVTFQYRVAGGGVYTDIGSDTSSPFEASWTPPLAAAFELRVKVSDHAGNVFTSAAVTVTAVDGGVTLADPGSPLSGTVTLTASPVGAVDHLAFEVAAAGTDAWASISTVTSSPWTASLDTKKLADGSYDVRVGAFDSAGGLLKYAKRSAVVVDNLRPTVVSTVPADGSVVTSGSSIVLTASEPIASVQSAAFDGAAVASPTIAGKVLTFATGAFSPGAHRLAGIFVDATGKLGAFRVNFSVPDTAKQVYIEKNTSPDGSTTVTSTDGTLKVTVPSGAYAKPAEGSAGADWLVVRITPKTTPTGQLPATMAIAGGLADVTATWNQAGTDQHTFDQPIDILLGTASGKVVPATYENGKWRTIMQVSVAGVLPTGWNDGWYLAADGYHVLSRHLTEFALLSDTGAPALPTGFTGTLAGGALTLSWTPGKDDDGTAATTILYVNGVEFARYGPGTTSAALGRFDAGDTRSFSLASVDWAGNVSAQTKALVGVPAVSGLTFDNAKSALTARGLVAGAVTTVASALPKNVVVSPTTTSVVATGSSVALSVSSGSTTSSGGTAGGTGAGATGGTSGGGLKPQAGGSSQKAETRLTFVAVGTRSFSLSKRRFVGARVNLSRAAQLTATLLDPRGRFVYRWRMRVGAGATLVRLVLPPKARKAGRYSIVWLATAGGQSARQQIRVTITAAAPTAKAKPTPSSKSTPTKRSTRPLKRVDVISVSGSLGRDVASGLPASTRVLNADVHSMFSAVVAKDRNVGVIVIDVDRYGAQAISDLKLVFPGIRIVAVVGEPVLSQAALKAGATVVVPPTAKADALRRTLVTLAHPAQ
jgi:hypothetical protein